MAVYNIAFVFALCCVVIQAQRPFYAGRRPIGYPETETNLLSNRFGEDADLPIEAKGDGNLVNRLNALPVDKQPFWFLNWRQYDALRKNPQTYPARPNVFANGK
ncbi:unnamed protein product [Euphydryas editha]|uniref:Seminal fluid protein HACP044 n=1 Tax=Euphydryas editha TaxID=104508 RepID=A0AAU9U4Z3_EUPED|nr:unnamed protein product [Euphydryas editha]